MSFGASPADVDIVVSFCRTLYRKCRDAGGEYDEISREVRDLHTVLKHLKYEVEAADSPVNYDRSIWTRQLAPVIGHCDHSLHELDDLLQEYSLFRHSRTSPNTSGEGTDRRLSQLDSLGLIRVKLLSYKSSLTKVLDNIQLHQLENAPEELDNSDGHLDAILDKVDIVAVRIGSQKKQGAGTICGDDEMELWKKFREELIVEGFSSEVLQQHRDVLRAYIREIDQNGLLDDGPLCFEPAPRPGVSTDRWLEPVKAVQLGDRPPTFSSLDLTTEDASAKAMIGREKNMKFPQSMKLEMRQPQIRGSGEGGTVSKRDVPSSSNTRGMSSRSHRVQPQIPKLITSDEAHEKEIQYFNTDGSSDEGSNNNSARRPKALSLGEVIKTTELIAYSQALQLHPASPSSFRSYGDYFPAYTTSQPGPLQQTYLESGTSPIQPGAIPIPQAQPGHSHVSFQTSPKPHQIRLAPDKHGNEIPPNAKWTKINRRLVSPEVLHQDHRRYEARPEFVAVLGVLSRPDIESLAERSRILRDARHRRSLPTQAPPLPQPPRPIPAPVYISRPHSRSHHRSGCETPSSSSSDSDYSDSDQHRRTKNKGRRGYAGSNTGAPISGYPNPFGQPLPSPVKSPRSKDGAWTSRNAHSTKDEERHRDRERGREGDHDRDGSRRRHSSNTSLARGIDHRDRGSGSGNQRSSRWKENLTAAGIGGAAVSLLSVLTEAAEGL